jgi:hypothetical protein
MKDWLKGNPDGLKVDFEQHFKALPADIRKVSISHDDHDPISLVLILTCTQAYKDQAAAAVRVLNYPFRIDKMY